MIIPKVIRFNTPAGYVDALAAEAIIASKFVAAAVRHNYRDGAVFEISLVDWDHDVVQYVIQSMTAVINAKPTFDFWLESIKLAVYLAMDLADICAAEISTDIDLARLIDVAVENKVVPMLNKLEGFVTAEMMPNLVKALAPVSTENIIWLINNDKMARIFAACGIVSRTSTEDTQTILSHTPLARSYNELSFVLDNCEILDPASRRMLKFIVRICEKTRKVADDFEKYKIRWLNGV